MEATLPKQPTNKPRKSSNNANENFYEIPHEGKILVCDRVTRVLGATKSNVSLLKYYGDKGTTEAERYRDETSEVGKATHALIEQHLTGKAPDPKLKITQPAIQRFGHFLDWYEAHKVEVVPGYRIAEHTVFSAISLVAGTLDLHLIVDSEEWVWDTKTGRVIKRDHAEQVAIYTVLEREGRARAVDDKDALEMFRRFWDLCEPPKIDWPRMGILHIPFGGLCSWEINPEEREYHAVNFARRLKCFRHDNSVRPFRRVWPCKEEKWLRAS